VVVGLIGAARVVEVLELVLKETTAPLNIATSSAIPISVPSALLPLSPLM
jgi:hypothetical protein